MGNTNPRALYVLAVSLVLLNEVCFIPVLSVFVETASPHNTTFCWSWRIGSNQADQDDTCPFLVFCLAALLNSCLLFFTGLYFALRLCLVAEHFQNRACLKVVIKYGHFCCSLVTTLLSVTFIGLMIGYQYSTDGNAQQEYTGGIVDDRHYYLMLVCVGALLSLFSTVLSGRLSLCRSSSTDRRGYGVDGSFSVFQDYSQSTPTYEQIN